MSKNRKLDWLATEIIANFEDLGFSKAYLKSKQLDLSGQDRLSVLRWCNCLDMYALNSLTNRLKINTADFLITIRTLRAI